MDHASTEALISLTSGLTEDREFPSPTMGIEHYHWALAGHAQSSIRRKWRFGRRQFDRYQQRDHQIAIHLDITDPSGGYYAGLDALNRGPRSDLVDSLVRSDAIIFLYDPLREVELGNTFGHTFGVLVEMARRMQGLPNGKLPHYVAVCITKFDEMRILDFAEHAGLLEYDVDPPGLPRVPEDDARDLFATLCEVSGSRTLSTVLNLLERAFRPERVKYFATSAIGFYIDPRKDTYDSRDYVNAVPEYEGMRSRIRGSVHPINVAEPLLWLCEKLAE